MMLIPIPGALDLGSRLILPSFSSTGCLMNRNKVSSSRGLQHPGARTSVRVRGEAAKFRVFTHARGNLLYGECKLSLVRPEGGQ